MCSLHCRPIWNHPEMSCQLACPQEEVEKPFSIPYSKREREKDLGWCNTLIAQLEATSQFYIKDSILKVVEEIKWPNKTSSVPGPSKVPYAVYKRCPKLFQKLWVLIRVIWRRQGSGDLKRVSGFWRRRAQLPLSGSASSHSLVLSARFSSALLPIAWKSSFWRFVISTPLCKRLKAIRC